MREIKLVKREKGEIDCVCVFVCFLFLVNLWAYRVTDLSRCVNYQFKTSYIWTYQRIVIVLCELRNVEACDGWLNVHFNEVNTHDLPSSKLTYKLYNTSYNMQIFVHQLRSDSVVYTWMLLCVRQVLLVVSCKL